jgi:hypothetical protein
MGRIRDKMEQDLVLCGRSAATCESYLTHARAFVVFLGRCPTTAKTRDIRGFLLYLLQEKKRKPTTVNVAIGALRFLFNVTLNRPEVMRGIRTVRVDHPQPDVLSGSEVQLLIEHAPSLKHKALVMLMYSAGLRVAEDNKSYTLNPPASYAVEHVRRSSAVFCMAAVESRNIECADLRSNPSMRRGTKPPRRARTEG